MAAARLHYGSHDIAVPIGAFFIGRGVDCQLSLDDPMVSRRHACLHVAERSARLEDLGSRNGVLLNGVRIDKIEPLHDGDVIRVGTHDLGFYFSADSRPVSSRRTTRDTRTNIPITMSDRPPPPSSKAPPSKVPSSRIPSTKNEPALMPFDPADASEQTSISITASPGGLAIIGTVADKALALGRADEAERILKRVLDDVLVRAQKGGAPAVSAELAERAASYALRLASATGRGPWIDYLFQLYTALALLMPARIVDELYAAVRKVKSTDKTVSREYIVRLRVGAQTFGPADRFILQRIEGLERFAP